jgi:hypothetical protein
MTTRAASRTALFALGVVLLLPRAGLAQNYDPAQTVQGDRVLEARVWLDRGAEPTFRRGETSRLYYRASQDAFVALFQIDTNGGARLLFPRSPDEPHRVRAGFDYRLLFPRSPFWQVEDDPGIGYFFVVASPEPFDFSSFGYSHFDRGWDLSRVGREVYRDPHMAMDDFVAALIPAWQSVPYALDFISYQVSDPVRTAARFEYPRFLCYECHGFRPYAMWNPYQFACTDFRLIVFTDPYYYPATRYRGSRVVFARPPQPFAPRFGFKERAASETSRPMLIEPERRASAPLIEPSAIRRALTDAARAGTTTSAPRAGTGATTGDPRTVPVPSTEQRRPTSTQGGDQRPSAPATSGGNARPSVPSGAGARPSVPPERPSTGTQQERLRPVLQPRPSPSSPPPAVTPPTARPSRGESVDPRTVPGATRTQPPTTNARPPESSPPPRTQPSTERPSPSTARPTPSSSGAPAPRTPSSGSSSSGTPAPVPAPGRPPVPRGL